MKNKKLVGIVVIILVVTLGVIGWMFAKKAQVPVPAQQLVNQNTASQQVTTDVLKTYTNEKFGFEIKYPKNWVVSDDKLNSVRFEKEDCDSVDCGFSFFSSDSQDITNNPTATQFLAKDIKDRKAGKNFPYIIEGGIVLIGDTDSLKYIDGGTSKSEGYFLFKNGRIFEVSPLPKDTVNKQDFDKIMATLKFTK